MKKLFLILLLISGIGFSQSHKQVKIQLKDKNSLRELIKSGMQFDHPYIDKDKTATVFIDDKDFEILKNSGYAYEVIIDDWKSFFEQREKLSPSQEEQFKAESKNNYGVEGFGYGSMGGYYTAAEVYQELDNMYNDYPNLITQKFSIGTTLENRDMWVVKISDNPNVDEDEPEIFFNSLIHAREPAGMMTIMYYMFYLLENYGTDHEVTYLVDNREIYFMPVFNVDGYEYNRTTDPNGGGMWRKNRKNNGGSYGVDLNRNFGYEWGYDNNGSSQYPSDETYRGTAPFSEPATQNVKLFCESREFKTGLNYHTYSNLLIIPWGYITQETEDSLAYREFASDMTSWNNYEWGTAGGILYEVNGSADDWMYGEQTTKEKILSMTPEVGGSSDGFWPSQSRIYPLAQENLQPNLYLTWAAGDFVGTIATSFTPEYANPGETVELSPIFRNKGLADASGITAELVSLSGLINVIESQVTLNTIASRETAIPDNKFKFTVSEAAAVGEPVQMVIYTKSNGTVMSADTVEFIPGVPTVLFADQNDDPSLLWNLNSTTSDDWESTTSSFYSAPTSYTESKNGSYSSYAETKMVSKNQISLNDVTSAILSFRTKWAIESSWDCGQVFISSNNGSSWNVLEGNYSKPGSGNGEQPSGQPVYDGTQSTWVLEEINISDYVGENVLLKFEFRADSYIEKDGWYLDDIKVYYYGQGSGNQACVDVDFSQGWNLISVPVNPSASALASIFPTSESNAFYFDETYVFTENLAPDLGYWIKFPAAGSATVCGIKTDNSVPLKAGWNIIGGNDSLHSVSALTTEPAGIIETSFFGFDNGYVTSEMIEAGKGYWVRASAAGTLNLNGVSTNKLDEKNSPSTGIKIIDAAGYFSNLYFENNSSLNADLPPLPPAGVFDARFNSGKFIEAVNTENIINLQGFSLPVEIQSTGVTLSVTLMNGKTYALQNGESVILTEVPGGSLTVSGISPDYDYSLAQNYPNPFNPETTISFALKQRENVTLEIYNTLGAKVATLINGVLEKGNHNIKFNTSDFSLSSGIYMYKLTAGEFTSVKKMVLLK